MPAVLGHEAAGIVVESRDDGIEVGARVVAYVGDAYASHVDAPADRIVLLDDDCSMLDGALAEPIESNGQTFSVGASIGLALGEDALNPSALLRNADTALYEAKRKGKGGTEVFSAPMHEKVARRYQVAEDLRHALSNGELRVAIQPIVSLADGKVVGGEALARWLHPTLGEITPTEFVRAAEEHGLSVQLTEVVLAQLRQVFFSCANATLISMNVSPGDLRHTELVASILGLAHEVAPHSLAIEVTESLLISDQDQLDTLRLFRERGIRVYIDDFGTGFATLDYLRRFSSADILKIDGSFVAGVTDPNSHDLAIVAAALVLADTLGFNVVAEGVETPAQVEVLQRLGCQFGQGYGPEKSALGRRIEDVEPQVVDLALGGVDAGVLYDDHA